MENEEKGSWLFLCTELNWGATLCFVKNISDVAMQLLVQAIFLVHKNVVTMLIVYAFYVKKIVSTSCLMFCKRVTLVCKMLNVSFEYSASCNVKCRCLVLFVVL